MSHMETIIEFVKENTFLYDSRHPNYKDSRSKDRKWMELAAAMDSDFETLKGQWKNLKDSYSRHLKCQINNSSPAAQKYQHWQWAKHMEFLKPHLNVTFRNSSLKENFSVPEETTNGHDQRTYEHQEKPNSPNIPHTSISNRPSTSCLNTRSMDAMETQTRRRQNTTDQESSSSVNPFKKSRNTNRSTSNIDKVIGYLQNRTEMDAVDYLFLSWAKTVKTFSPRRLLNTKIKISNVIMQQEADQLEEDTMNQQPSHTSILSVDTSTRSTPVTPESNATVSPCFDGYLPKEPQVIISENAE